MIPLPKLRTSWGRAQTWCVHRWPQVQSACGIKICKTLFLDRSWTLLSWAAIHTSRGFRVHVRPLNTSKTHAAILLTNPSRWAMPGDHRGASFRRGERSWSLCLGVIPILCLRMHRASSMVRVEGPGGLQGACKGYPCCQARYHT